jgi:hypothetical protein
MKEKTILISVATLLILAMPVFAQNLGAQSMSLRPVITTFGILGKGIASSPSDPLNFKIVKAGIGTVRVYVLDQQTELTVGVLFLDDQRYTFKNIVIGNGSASADIYINDTQHGTISLTSVIKGNTEIWAGTMSVDGASYNTYILGGYRPIQPVELKEKVSEYCSENATDHNCGGKIQDFCQNNPTDMRCLALFKAFCLTKNNMDDSRCREFMVDWCKDKNDTNDCKVFVVKRSEAYCATHSTTNTCQAVEQKLANLTEKGQNYCAEHPNTVICKAFCRNFPDKCNATQPPEQPSEAEQACTSSGGTVINTSCCISASDFPDTCHIGACGCSPENSKEVETCDCGEGKCFDGGKCTPSMRTPEQRCTNSGGTVTNATCCNSASDFPNTCAIGACGCSADNSKQVRTCDCGEGKCFNGNLCVNQEGE